MSVKTNKAEAATKSKTAAALQAVEDIVYGSVGFRPQCMPVLDMLLLLACVSRLCR